MANNKPVCNYERHSNLGKIVHDRKNQHQALKDIERKLSSLSKRINDLRNQKKLAYKNAIKIKKTIHNEINEIIKSFRGRERNLLCEVDEAYYIQDSRIDDDLTKLLSTHSCCHSLYSSLEDFKDNQSALTKINDLLNTVSVEKPVVQQFVFKSWAGQAQVVANEYGYLDEDFSEKIESSIIHKTRSSALSSILSLDKNALGEYHCSESSLRKNCDISAVKNLTENVNKRQRTDSQDSFEIVDLLESMHCQEDENFAMSEIDCTIFTEKCLSEKNDPTDISDESFNEKFSNEDTDMKKLINELNDRMKRILPVSNVKREKNTIHYKAEKEIQRPALMTDEDRSWLQKHPCQKDVLKTNENSQSNKFETNLIGSPADVIKILFSPYFIEESNTSWLSSK